MRGVVVVVAICLCGSIAAAQDSRREKNLRLAELMWNQDYAGATKLAEQVVQLHEQQFGKNDDRTGLAAGDLAAVYKSHADFYRVQGQFAEAEHLYKRSLAIWEEVAGPNDPNTVSVREALAANTRREIKKPERWEVPKGTLLPPGGMEAMARPAQPLPPGTLRPAEQIPQAGKPVVAENAPIMPAVKAQEPKAAVTTQKSRTWSEWAFGSNSSDAKKAAEKSTSEAPNHRFRRELFQPFIRAVAGCRSTKETTDPLVTELKVLQMQGLSESEKNVYKIFEIVTGDQIKLFRLEEAKQQSNLFVGDTLKTMAELRVYKEKLEPVYNEAAAMAAQGKILVELGAPAFKEWNNAMARFVEIVEAEPFAQSAGTKYLDYANLKQVLAAKTAACMSTAADVINNGGVLPNRK